MSIKIKDQDAVNLSRRALEASLHFEKIGQLKKIFQDIVNSRNEQRHRVLLAVDSDSGNRPVGVMVVLAKTRLSSTRLTRNVHVYVAPRYRRAGVAAMLFDHLQRRHGLPGYLLNTRVGGMSSFFDRFNVFQVPSRIDIDVSGLDFGRLEKRDQVAIAMRAVVKQITVPESQHVRKYAALHARRM